MKPEKEKLTGTKLKFYEVIFESDTPNGILAVPTGIVSAGMVQLKAKGSNQRCPHCRKEGHDADAVWCKYCGGKLN